MNTLVWGLRVVLFKSFDYTAILFIVFIVYKSSLGNLKKLKNSVCFLSIKSRKRRIKIKRVQYFGLYLLNIYNNTINLKYVS